MVHQIFQTKLSNFITFMLSYAIPWTEKGRFHFALGKLHSVGFALLETLVLIQEKPESLLFKKTKQRVSAPPWKHLSDTHLFSYCLWDSVFLLIIDSKKYLAMPWLLDFSKCLTPLHSNLNLCLLKLLKVRGPRDSLSSLWMLLTPLEVPFPF